MSGMGKHAPNWETGYIRRVVSAMLKAGYAISVDNGGDEDELAIAKSTSHTAITDELCHCEWEQLDCYDVDTGLYVGSAAIIWGESQRDDPSEVINDYHVSLEHIFDSVK